MISSKIGFVAPVKKSRKFQAGDILTFKLNYVSEFFFAKIICDHLAEHPKAEITSELVLVYIYRTRSIDKLSIPELHSNELLIQPYILARSICSRLFEKVGHRAIEESDYCNNSVWLDMGRDYYKVDFRKNEWAKIESPPSSVWVSGTGIAMPALIEEVICDALGLPSPYS